MPSHKNFAGFSEKDILQAENEKLLASYSDLQVSFAMQNDTIKQLRKDYAESCQELDNCKSIIDLLKANLVTAEEHNKQLLAQYDEKCRALELANTGLRIAVAFLNAFNNRITIADIISQSKSELEGK